MSFDAGATGAALTRTFEVAIADDDADELGEGGTATYEVTLDRSPSAGVDVDWAVAGTGDDAADFVGGLPSGTTDLTRTFGRE